MCRNITSLVYGLPVRTYTLARAADAWPALEPAMRFFDLVSLRLRKGELEASRKADAGAAVERVPLEVWMLVRDELIDLELDKAERELIREFCCWCEYWDDEAEDLVLPAGSTWCRVAKAAYPPSRCWCDNCYEFTDVWEYERLERVPVVLHAFGLALPRETPLTSRRLCVDEPDEPWFDLFSATVISLPAAAAPAVEDPFQLSNKPDDFSVFDLSFSTPLSAQRNLTSFARTFRLEPLTIVDDTRAPPAEGGLAVPPQRANEPTATRFGACSLQDAEPGWMAVCSCRTE
ncbi:hypothetical protein JCM6882_004017 [Rhodosporidiobolus microsporus]